MAKIEKHLQSQNLQQYQVYAIDTGSNSQYFQISELQDVLTSGKNAFLINGSLDLEPTTELKVELLDSLGHTVFLQPIKNYSEGLARIVSIEVYKTTPPGPGTLTILGELRNELVPSQWTGSYNVKWQRKITIDPIRPNITKIRLYDAPTLIVSESLVPVRNVINQPSMSVSGGILSGSNGSTTYNELTTIVGSGTQFISDMENGTFLALASSDGISFPITSSVDRVINSNTLQINYIPSSSFDILSYQLTYIPSSSYTDTQLTRSFADISLTNLTTFSGDIYRAKFFMKSVESSANYEQIADVLLDKTELTVTTSINVPDRAKQIGYFTSQNDINSYWKTGLISNGNYQVGTIPVNYDSLQLLDSAHLNTTSSFTATSSVPIYYFGTSSPMSFIAGTECKLRCNILSLSSGSAANIMSIYLSGSAFPSTDPLGYKLDSFAYPMNISRNLILDYENNFIAENTGTGYLNFVITSGDWRFSDIHVEVASDDGFNPDMFDTMIPVIGKRFQTLQFKTELFDVNNNMIPLLIESLPVFFNGGNIVLQGNDHRISGAIIVSPSGSGPVIASTSVGSFIGIGQGDGNAVLTIPYPINSANLENYNGPPIVSIYSGSSPYPLLPGTSSLGLQLHGGSTSGSYLDFNTADSILRIRGSIELLPGTPLSGSISSLVQSSSLSGDGPLALSQIQDLVNASGSFPSGTFLDGYMIRTPLIVGSTGYIAEQFGVGDISAGKGIVLTALGYTASNGTPVPSLPAVYIGHGQFSNNNTPFFVASSSTGGIMSLGSSLVWDGTNLNVVGGITITGGNAATTASVNSVSSSFSTTITSQGVTIASNSSSLAGSITTNTTAITAQGVTITSNSSSLAATGVAVSSSFSTTITAQAITIASNSSSLAGSITTTNTNSTNYSASLASSIFTNTTGLVTKTPSVSSAGLYLGVANLGYYNGSAWKTYMDNTGKFFLAGTGGNALYWDGSSTLSITGSINATSGIISGNLNILSGGSFTVSLTNSVLTMGMVPSSSSTPASFFYDGGGNFKETFNTLSNVSALYNNGGQSRIYFSSTDSIGIIASSIIRLNAGGNSTIDLFSTAIAYGASSHVFTSTINDTTATTVEVHGQITTTTNATIGGTLGVTGITTMAAVSASSLAVSGNQTVAGTLGVTGILSATTIQASGDITAYYSSDIRLKNNIKLIESPLEKLNKISGYEFIWNENSEYNGKDDVGVIAQEIETILPQIVVTRNNGYKAVRYEKIIPLLIEAIKELSNKR